MSNTQQQQQQQQEQAAPKRLEGKVKSVLSGDTLVLAHPTKIFPAIEKVLTLVRIQAPRMAKRGEETEEAFAFEAREFLRRKCIGKLVSFQVEYRNAETKRDFGTVFLDGENLGEAVLREGLAKLKPSKHEDEFQNLVQAQEEAKSKKVGLWSDKANKQTRHITWQVKDAEALLKSFKGKTVNVIVEYVMNGSSLRVLLPSNEMVVVHLTGIQCPSIKIEEKKTGDKVEKVEVGSMWSKEARHYTEVRVLHREVTMLFEGTDNNESLCGSILMSVNEDSEQPVIFQEELLMRGFASIAEWNIARSKYANRLRKAEALAKSKKLRLWVNYEPPVATLKTEDQNQFNAQVIEVLSGDTVRIVDENGREERLSLSSIRAQRFKGGKDASAKDNTPATAAATASGKDTGAKGGKNKDKSNKDKDVSNAKYKDAEPWAYEARDTLRKKVVGKTVQVKIDYRRSLSRPVVHTKMVNGQRQQVETVENEERRFGTIFVNKVPVAVDLVKNGYASVIKHKSDEERSIAYDQLMLAESEAKKKNKGLHGPKKNAPIHKITEIQDNQSAQYLVGLKDKKIKAIVEKVFTGTRFKLLLPKESYTITFALTGISCPSLKPKDEKEPKPFAIEALRYAIDQLMMRDVEIIIRDVDKIGSFMGEIFVGNNNYAINILKAGYGMLQKSAERALNYEELKNAEEVARSAQKNVWSVDPSIFKSKKQKQIEEERASVAPTTKLVKGKPFDIRVTEIIDATHFYIQRADSIDVIEKVDNLLAAIDPDSLEQAKHYDADQVVLAYYKDEDAWFRAKVLKSHKDNSVTVFYTDYGSSEVLSPSELRVLPKDSELCKIKPTVIECKLAFVKLHPENFVDDAKLFFTELVSGDKDLEAIIEYTDHRNKNNVQYVTLIDKADDTNINQTLVRNGLVFVDNSHKRFDEFKTTYAAMEEELAAAKRDKCYLWEDGDLYDSDEE